MEVKRRTMIMTTKKRTVTLMLKRKARMYSPRGRTTMTTIMTMTTMVDKRGRKEIRTIIGFNPQGWVEHFPKLNLLVDVVEDEISNWRQVRKGDKILVYEVVSSNPKEVCFKYEVPIKPVEDSCDQRNIVTVQKHKNLLLVIFYQQSDTTTLNEFHLFKFTPDGVKESKPLYGGGYTDYSKVEYETHLPADGNYKIVFCDTEQYFEIIRKELPAKIHYIFDS